MPIKANKKTENFVSIPIEEAIALIRQYINQHGSREAGLYVSIPETANWEVSSGTVRFAWIENE